MSLRKSIGANIRQIRLQKNLTQEELASVLFITRQTLSNYETGRSNPDIDMLQKIAAALDVELTWLLYGIPPAPPEKKPAKETLLLIGLFALLATVTCVLCRTTSVTKTTQLRPASNLLVRLILVPLTMIFLGYDLLQVLDHFLGIARPSPEWQKRGRRLTIGVLWANVLFTIPYVAVCFSALFSGPGTVSLSIPQIPIYEKKAFLFLTLMYQYPFAYVLTGISLWIFRGKSKCKN